MLLFLLESGSAGGWEAGKRKMKISERDCENDIEMVKYGSVKWRGARRRRKRLARGMAAGGGWRKWRRRNSAIEESQPAAISIYSKAIGNQINNAII